MKAHRLVSTLILAAFILSACGASAAPAADPPPLKVGWSLWPGFYPMLIAKEKGFFEAHGVMVEPKPYGTITEQHGGQVSVESKVGQGTRFSVSLPILAVS